ncbi:unnamed protein product [Closterium sp. NIES-54]
MWLVRRRQQPTDAQRCNSSQPSARICERAHCCLLRGNAGQSLCCSIGTPSTCCVGGSPFCSAGVAPLRNAGRRSTMLCSILLLPAPVSSYRLTPVCKGRGGGGGGKSGGGGGGKSGGGGGGKSGGGGGGKSGGGGGKSGGLSQQSAVQIQSLAARQGAAGKGSPAAAAQRAAAAPSKVTTQNAAALQSFTATTFGGVEKGSFASEAQSQAAVNGK